MAGELSDIGDARRRAPTSGVDDSGDRVADQLGVLRRAVTTRALHPDLSFELVRSGDAVTLYVVDARTGRRAPLIEPGDWQ